MSFSYEFEDGTPFNNNFPFNTNLNDLESRDCAVVLWNDDIVQTEQCGHGSYFVCQGMSANWSPILFPIFLNVPRSLQKFEKEQFLRTLKLQGLHHRCVTLTTDGLQVAH